MAETKTKSKKKSTKKVDVFKEHGVSPELALDMIRNMLLYRRFEEKVEEAYAIGKIGGFCHLHIGQEGACVGSIKPLRDDDYVMSAYREHTQAIAKGVEPNAVMAELYGRADGASGGKGGSMHIFNAATRFMGGHGIVGGQVPLATGIAWKIKYRKEDSVVIVYMGDAAVNQGGFHEALNMAAVWELPAIYVVENNGYGMGTAFSRVSKTDMASKAVPHGIPSSSVDGQDVLATYAHFRDLAEEVRGGGGPRFVDLKTYRFRGHSMSDPVSGTYRPTAEVEKKKEENDPITILRDHLFAAGHMDQEGLEAMDAEARQISQGAADFAEASPLPDPSQLYANVWAEINANGRLFFDGRGEE
ncbi:MAG: pyruvate dehydrogenase (acetyl-transferring) E1 component subunit alpha [Gemmatimonadales bacterium]|jgi:pyruvate dehydrogenase E1 component alpha subunit|nr:pyruvate dehydrogenase (acetyl-transferring) E1 component subunit alpha [Gemmatimonadales bacterium]MDG2239890.1 pyruvate dehydrogenase (acetyl-transferring) E1 component subunit alpha [Longimicrobiales bacterium]MBT3499246.1 pyruvate dehydrogenase (acetyl-transferring) E1 component subunit alpha [Gemmatimonadales bacterium]MBT3774035.1 pyruvate dehydrogenase (acetyl-transferring) E1 component subunit alpha [Gemmatimonadales bacterium]MBT3959799.1 pyruvate dehydrogenase (acetyl-transferring)